MIVAQNIEAANDATRSIAQQQIRVHVCWGANEGPHSHDTELKDIVDLLVKLRCGGLSIVSANGRHEHEWRVWDRVPLADGMKLIPGVIDSTTNIDIGRCWIKLSPRISLQETFPFSDVRPMVDALLKRAPNRLLWGSDWPHPQYWRPMPSDTDLLDQMIDWVPDEADRHRIFVDNPIEAFGFPHL